MEIMTLTMRVSGILGYRSCQTSCTRQIRICSSQEKIEPLTWNQLASSNLWSFSSFIKQCKPSSSVSSTHWVRYFPEQRCSPLLSPLSSPCPLFPLPLQLKQQSRRTMRTNETQRIILPRRCRDDIESTCGRVRKKRYHG